MTFLELAEVVLKEAKTPLHYKEMWQKAVRGKILHSTFCYICYNHGFKF
ncbi:HTH domain-containing protein [Helicobacter sp. T3_23-1059]